MEDSNNDTELNWPNTSDVLDDMKSLFPVWKENNMCTETAKGKIFMGKDAFRLLCKKGALHCYDSAKAGKITCILTPLLGGHDAVTFDPLLIEIINEFENKKL